METVLLDALNSLEPHENEFDAIIEPLLEEFMEAAAIAQVANIKYDSLVSTLI